MIHLKDEICGALAGACALVVYGYPKDFTGREVLAWRESGNRRHAQADGEEYLAELEYTLEIFVPGAEAASAILAEADGRMRTIGLRRESAAEQFEQHSALNHITARYRALVGVDGRVYQ